MTTKNQKLKMALTSTPMILIYVMVVFCLIAAIREPAFLSPATAINLARAGIFTMCFAICEMVVIISGGIDVSFPAVGCVAMYVPLYMYSGLLSEAAASDCHAGHQFCGFRRPGDVAGHPRVYNAAQLPSEPV